MGRLTGIRMREREREGYRDKCVGEAGVLSAGVEEGGGPSGIAHATGPADPMHVLVVRLGQIEVHHL